MTESDTGSLRQATLSDEDWRLNQPYPWRDESLMHRLYVEEQRSANDIRKLFDCSLSTIGTWLEKHDSIEKRTRSEACQAGRGALNKANYNTSTRGYEYWGPGNTHVYVHRLVAVAEWGFDEVCSNHVHHKNGVPWDNRPSNLEVVSNSDHQKRHRKVGWLDRLRIAELYEYSGISSRDLAEMFDVSGCTILAIHDEFYGDDPDE